MDKVDKTDPEYRKAIFKAVVEYRKKVLDSLAKT